jgi:RHS repeat-associated protein
VKIQHWIWIVTLGLTSAVADARAQLRQDALVQAPEIKAPARGTVGSSLASFELGPATLARGSAGMPSPFAAPTERGEPALAFLPTYVADQGLSEWGMGWAASISIRRFRPIGAIDYVTDRFTSPWGTLSRGDDGAYYADGLAARIRFTLADEAWRAIAPNGTEYVFRSKDALTTPRGTYEWWISEATTLEGERTTFQYDVGTDQRRYLTSATYGGRAGTAQTKVELIYEPLSMPFVDRRSGVAVRLDRRVAAAAVAMWELASASFVERYRYELSYTTGPAGATHYLSHVRRVFASGATEPTARYTYRFGEDDAMVATIHEASGLTSYLERHGVGSLSPSQASYVDIDRDGRTDVEHAFDQELAVHTDGGLDFEALPRDGSEFALCRPTASRANAPRIALRLAPKDPDYSVLRFVRPVNDTSIHRCDRQGHLLSTTQLSGDWRLGPNTRLTDVDRDFRPDLVRLTRGQVEVRRNMTDATLAFGPATRQRLEPALETSRSWVADLTGDGVGDLVAVARSAFLVWPGLGNGAFETEGIRLPLFTQSGADVGSIEDTEVAFVDANRDGLGDVLLSRGAQLRLLTNRGASLREIDVPAFRGLSWDFSYPITVDLEGVGEEQAVVSAGKVAHAISFTSPSAGLMTMAEDGKGGKLELGYERAPATPGITMRPPLLSFMRVEDVGRDPIEYRFDYDQPVFHSEGEYLLGYRHVRRTSPTSVDESEFYHDDAQTALPLQTRSVDRLLSDSASGLFRFSETRYEATTFRRLPFRRAVATQSGFRDSSGASLLASLSTTPTWSADGLCPLVNVVVNAEQQLTSTRTLATPKRLDGALHCLLATEQQTAVHTGNTELDFSYNAHVTRNAIGQVESVELRHGTRSLVTQVNRYDGQHRLHETGAPGRGTTRITYQPITGDVASIVGPDGVSHTVREIDSRSTKATFIAEDRGARSPYETHVTYDGLERYQSRFDNVGAGNAARPDETVSYAFASATRPASIVSSALIDAARAAYATEAEWLAADGGTLARGTLIPEGWAVSDLSVVTRVLARTDAYRRDPIPSIEAAAVSLSELVDPAHSTRLSRATSSLLGHSPFSESLVQGGTSRMLTQTLILAGRRLVRETFENDTLIGIERLDGDQRRVEQTDALGNTTRVTYDAMGRIVRVDLPGGASEIVRFDGFGRPGRVTRSGIGAIEYEYDAHGLLEEMRHYSATGALVRRTRHESDAIGREVGRRYERADGASQEYEFSFDGKQPEGGSAPGQRGRATGVRGPGYERRTSYGPDGRLAASELSIIGWRRVKDSYEYFEDGRVKSHEREIQGADGSIRFDQKRITERDNFGREVRVLVEGETPRTLYEVQYDNEGRVSQITLGGDAGFNTTQGSVALTYDDATHAGRGYNQVAPDWEIQVDRELDSRGLAKIERIGYRNGQDGMQIHDREYGYDARRFLERMTSGDGSARYGYEPSGLLGAVSDDEDVVPITRDASTVRLGARTYEFDDVGRLSDSSDVTFAFGPNGQIDRATRGGKTVEFLYDESEQRLLKQVQGSPVVAYLAGGVLTERGLVEPLSVGGRVVAVLENGILRALATDPRSTVVAGDDGSYLSATPYGVRTMHPESAEAIDFAANGFDSDLGLVRMGVRDYDPLIGQFTTPDPLYIEDLEKCGANAVECNLYGYARNDPVGYVDPTGTEANSPFQADAFFERSGSISEGVDSHSPVKVCVGNGAIKAGYTGVKVEVSALKLQLESDHVVLEHTAMQATVMAGIVGENQFGIGASAVLGEVKVGVKGHLEDLILGPVAAANMHLDNLYGPSISVSAVGALGVGGGALYNNGKITVGAKVLVGAELAIDANAGILPSYRPMGVDAPTRFSPDPIRVGERSVQRDSLSR